MRIGAMREAKIQTEIKKHLEAKGYLVVKILQSTLNGWPDLQAMKGGKIYFIEVKRPGEKLEPLQEYRHKQLEALGFTCITARGVQDIEGLK